MNEQDYKDFVSVLAKPGSDIVEQLTPQDADLLHMTVGVVGEAAELIDAVQNLDVNNVTEELGDIEFYLQGIRNNIGLSRHQIMAVNFLGAASDPASRQTMVIGVVKEAGKLIDTVKKRVIYRKTLDLDNLGQELRGLEFYLSHIRGHFDLTRDQIIAANVQKLSVRYAQKTADGSTNVGYSDASAQARKDKS
jgi:phosphoribosyl-ATP pyrophosphohydrolase